MEELNYRELLEKISFPCMGVLDYGGRSERERMITKEDSKELKKYRRKSEKEGKHFIIVPLFLGGRIFLIKKGKYIYTYTGGGLESEPQKCNIKEILQETEPPYFIFRKKNQEAKLAEEIKEKNKSRLEKYRKKSKESERVFYIFPHKTSSYLYFYQVVNGEIIGLTI